MDRGDEGRPGVHVAAELPGLPAARDARCVRAPRRPSRPRPHRPGPCLRAGRGVPPRGAGRPSSPDSRQARAAGAGPSPDGHSQDRRATAGRHRRHRGRHCRVVRRDGGVADPVAVPLLRLTASRARDRRHPAQPRLDVLRRPGLAQPPGARQATRPHADAGDRRARRRPGLRPGCDGRSRPAADPPAAAAAHPHRRRPRNRRSRRRGSSYETAPSLSNLASRSPDSAPTVSRRCCCRPSATRSATR